MVDIIKSPDGKHVMSENSDLPEHMKSKWIPIEEWEEDFNRSQSNWQSALKELSAMYTNN